MRNFNHDNRSYDKRGSGKRFGDRNNDRRDYGSRDSGKPAMYQAVCAECGNSCEVPFKPADGKPVYCRDCYSKRKKF